jgi:TatD DNase family protein
LLTDSHCHLASHKFPPEEIPALLQRAQANGIHRMITLATSLDDIEANIQLAEQYPQIHTAIGIHPCDVHQTPDDYMESVRKFIVHPKCCAIGETGLDYFHPAPQNEGWTDTDYHARQRQFLHHHFQLAAEHGKNIVIHTRDKAGSASLNDAVEIYRQYADKVTAVFHCFLGPWENAQQILDLGGYLSYTGITTFKKATATLAAATLTPPDRIMVETDSPYLAPTPHRGQRNEPAYTLHTATTIAAARGITLQELATITEQNVNHFFKLQRS